MFSNGLSTIETDELHAYEEGIKSPFLIRYPAWFKPGTVNDELVLALEEHGPIAGIASAAYGTRRTGRATRS